MEETMKIGKGQASSFSHIENKNSLADKTPQTHSLEEIPQGEEAKRQRRKREGRRRSNYAEDEVCPVRRWGVRFAYRSSRSDDGRHKRSPHRSDRVVRDDRCARRKRNRHGYRWRNDESVGGRL